MPVTTPANKEDRLKSFKNKGKDNEVFHNYFITIIKLFFKVNTNNKMQDVYFS